MDVEYKKSGYDLWRKDKGDGKGGGMMVVVQSGVKTMKVESGKGYAGSGRGIKEEGGYHESNDGICSS